MFIDAEGNVMSTFRLLCVLIVGVLVCVGVVEGGESGVGKRLRPNVVFILVDDLGWMDLGVQGSRYYKTPNIDGLAGEGMRFTDAYASASICSPTRSAVMTGLSPARTGITDWIRAGFQGGKSKDGKQPSGYERTRKGRMLTPRNPLWMGREYVTIAERMKGMGYRTGFIGKWHLGSQGFWPKDQGFDENVAGCDYGHPPSYFDPYINKGQPVFPTMKVRKKGEYLTDRLGDEAVDFIKEHRGEPFFLMLNTYTVHTPIQAKPQLVRRFDVKDKKGQRSAKYAAMVKSLDENVGKVLEAVKRCGLENDTIVVFTSDNGGHGGFTNHKPLRGAKGHPYEGGIRVPLIVKYPGVVKAGVLSDAVVSSVDFVPTLVEGVGGALAGDVDGESFWDVLVGWKGLKNRGAQYWHYPHYRDAKTPPYSIVRDGDLKLLYWWEKGKVELYDLKADLGETENLVLSRPADTRRLKGMLDAYLKRVGAKLPRWE